VFSALSRIVQPASSGHYDELRSLGERGEHAGSIGHDWATFFRQAEGGLADMDRRQRELEHQIRDNGITYNVYADEDGPQRPWSVDLFPLILGEHDWRQIEAGVLQRAQLLEKIVADTYGEQRLLREALIPPALIQGHPGYLRAMHGAPAIARHLHIVAFDLAREPDGHWSVVAQRTEAPSGLGYLLENRMLISRQFTAAYDAMQVQPLTEVYRELIDGLKRLSPAGAASHIALLTPGPYNETYFEHAYLARQLGLTLAEGSDLTVRDQKLYLRTLRGLEPVHVLLKRLDDAFLDPLELRADSTLGVPGLLQAVRAGNVVMANAPGTGFLESPALLGFLPALSERLLGQPLQLPALNTWWCGERAAMDEALSQLPHCVIKPTFPRSPLHEGFEPVLAGTLTQAESDAWRDRIRRNPDAHTLQSYLPLAQMPTWRSGPDGDSGILPRSFKLRVFALRNGPDSWYVLPGGMARIAQHESAIASMQRGGSSADVWVRSSSPPTLSMTTSPQTKDPKTAPRRRSVTSRAAENLFWLGRYTERAESSLHLARVCLQSLNSESPCSQRTWQWLAQLAQREGLLPHDLSMTTASDHHHPVAAPLPASHRRLIERMLIGGLDGYEQTSPGFNLRALKAAASSVRERLSSEQWNAIVDCVRQYGEGCADTVLRHDASVAQALTVLSSTRHALAAITGAQTDRMTRDDGWQLLSIGRHIDRLDFLANALETGVRAGILDAPSDDGSGFVALLALFDCSITYQAQYQQDRALTALVELLVADRENPRSLAWVARSLRSRLTTLAQLPLAELNGWEVPAPDDWDLGALCTPDEQGQLAALHAQLAACTQACRQISDAINARHFNHTRDISVES
jgi:uncharacterized circularly permuted ATP-grasp superfamily protein/uncharacterized alpha-E superfamily protein